MRILVTYPLSSELVQAGLGELVAYRPELASQPDRVLEDALRDQRPDAALIGDRCPATTALADWRQGADRDVSLIRCHRGTRPPGVELPGVDACWVDGSPTEPRADLDALGLAERFVARRHAEQRLAACGIAPDAARSLAGSRVTLVGAGIVNLMAALDLVEHGAEIEILEASPDPRTRPPWQRLGTTHGGDNARMFCFTEADNYNEKGRLAYAKMHQVLRRTITDGGWLAVEPEHLSPQERHWIECFHALPRWRAELFTEDIHGFTIASYPLWQRLRAEAPHLFDRVGYTNGVLQLYETAEMAEADEALHHRLGSLERALDSGGLSRRHPACRAAVENGWIARGLEVRGFTLEIHGFVDRLLAHLEARGVRLRWNRRVRTIERSAGGDVTGLASDGGVVRSEHYVLSPGVHGGHLLDGTRTAGKMQGILGLWLSFGNHSPRLRRSIKLHREGHAGEDSNIVLATDDAGRPILILGSGYGYLGSQPLDMRSPQVERLFEALEETVQRTFPRAYARALRDGTLAGSRKACVRPFTSTGLGIFDVSATATGGRMVIASGHNTGGFAQAPVVAQAIVATLEGSPHPMQGLYDPERGIACGAAID